MERYNHGEAMAEAAAMKEKISSGEAEDYSSAEVMVAKDSSFETIEMHKPNEEHLTQGLDSLQERESGEPKLARAEFIERVTREKFFTELKLSDTDLAEMIKNLIEEKENFSEEEVEILKRSFENIRETIRIFLDIYLRDFASTTDFDKDADYIFNELVSEIKRISEGAVISHVIDIEGFLDSVSVGRVKGILALDENELRRVKDRKKKSTGFSATFKKGDGEGYLDGRREVEESLGYSDAAVYGTLQVGESSGYSSYGDVRIDLDPSLLRGVYFTEGDSLATQGMAGEIAKRKNFKNKDNNKGEVGAMAARLAPKRQLILPHAIISKATYTILDREYVAKHHKSSPYEGSQGYTEAHIVGGIPLDSPAIKKVSVDARWGMSSREKRMLSEGLKESPNFKFEQLEWVY